MVNTSMIQQESNMTKAKHDPPPETRECRYCSTFFKPTKYGHVYCSRQCKHKYARMLKALRYAEEHSKGRPQETGR